MPESVEKRLTAILIMDVVGYSRQMAANEAGTLARVTAARREVFDGAVTGNGGRVVKLMGDGALVEFPSVTGAVLAARAIQQGLASFNAARPGDEPLQVRIGVNLGEVIVQDGDLYGDGVNVAARLEALAEPGAILIAGAARAQLRDLDGVGFKDLGPQWVKNIPEPVHVFKITDGDGDSVLNRPRPVPRRLAPAVLVAVVVLLGAAWWFVPQVRDMLAPTVPPVASLASESRPSLAVMPFENLSGDAEQNYFSDGMADSLISDLSKVSGLLVIARNTSFSFRDRGESMDARSVGAELGVRYVVAGSVQRSGRKVRISANLTDAQNGIQLWGARLDREFEDLFALQDDVTTQIIGALQVELSQEERRRLSKHYTDSLDAYDLYLRAWEEIWRFNEDARRNGQAFLLRALRIDPDFALAKALLATTYTNRAGVALLDNEQVLEQGYRIALEAVEIDPDLPQVYTSLGLVHMFRREYAEAEAAFKRAVQIDPNYADGYGLQGWNRLYAGNPQAGWSFFSVCFAAKPPCTVPLSERHVRDPVQPAQLREKSGAGAGSLGTKPRGAAATSVPGCDLHGIGTRRRCTLGNRRGAAIAARVAPARHPLHRALRQARGTGAPNRSLAPCRVARIGVDRAFACDQKQRMPPERSTQTSRAHDRAYRHLPALSNLRCA